MLTIIVDSFPAVVVELDVSNTLYGGGALLGEIFANMPFLSK